MDARPVTIQIDLSVYHLESIKKAAYIFGDRCHIAIECVEPTKAQVTLTAKRIVENPTHLAVEFQNELLDQELRFTVAAETRTIRDLLLAQVFSATSLLNPLADDADFRQDPLKIAHADGIAKAEGP